MVDSVGRVFGLLCLITLTGCDTVASQQMQAAPVEQRMTLSSYALHPNDVVRIRLYNEPEISGEYEIDAAGYISVPLAGRVKAASLTPQQLERAIISQLSKGLLRDPRVSVQVARYAPIYVHGEVKRGGEYPFRPGLTAMDAIAAAGGFTYRAAEDKILIRRFGSNVEEIYSGTNPVPVYPGDNIRIGERLF